MPSSKDRRRVEVAAEVYDRLKLLADSEERTLTNVIHDLLQLGLKHYQSTWLPHFFRERFNAQAQQALMLAKEEAQLLGHNYVGTEHLLLGLLRQNDGIAAQVLRQLWIDLDKTRKGLAYIMAYSAKAQSTTQGAAATPTAGAAMAGAATQPVVTQAITTTPATAGATAQLGVPSDATAQAQAQAQAHAHALTSAPAPTPASPAASEEAGATEADATPAEEAPETGYTLRMRKVLDFAVDEAQRLGHDYVGTEHLLLALAREGEGLAAGLLRTFGALGRVREFTLAALRQREAGGSADTTASTAS